MGTGRGKSVFFLLPVLISGPNSLLVIIVPLVSLQIDLFRRCQELQIRVRIWDPKNTAIESQILLITPESAISQRFLEFLGRQKMQNNLDRIFIDECHILLDSTAVFRPKLRALKKLLALEVPIYYLTATLPP